MLKNTGVTRKEMLAPVDLPVLGSTSGSRDKTASGTGRKTVSAAREPTTRGCGVRLAVDELSGAFLQSRSTSRMTNFPD